ncbi:MAG TPA: ABC transporter ATP-binding protein [Candidatus Binataceae bacterium]
MRDLAFERVSVAYGHVAALSDLSLRCASGRVTCLLGPNGAGKSTALAAAAGMIKIRSGRIMIGSSGIAPHLPFQGRSYLPQNGSFSKLLTVREVLEFAGAMSSTSTLQYARSLNATGVREVFNRRVGELSGGWERRVGLAWALLQPADVLLLDEPLVGLDPETLDRAVEHFAQRAADGNTVVMATHDFEAVDSLQPAVAVLEEGKLIARFEHEKGSLRDIYRATLMGQAMSNVSAP